MDASQYRTQHAEVVEDIISYNRISQSRSSAEEGYFMLSLPLTNEKSYFEIKILETAPFLNGSVTVGLVPSNYDLNDSPGWFVNSVGYWCKGRIDRHALHLQEVVVPSYCKDDNVGCGMRSEGDQEGYPRSCTVYFTKAGEEVYSTEMKVLTSSLQLHPAVVLMPGAKVKIAVWPFKAAEVETRLLERYRSNMDKMRLAERRTLSDYLFKTIEEMAKKFSIECLHTHNMHGTYMEQRANDLLEEERRRYFSTNKHNQNLEMAWKVRLDESHRQYNNRMLQLCKGDREFDEVHEQEVRSAIQHLELLQDGRGTEVWNETITKLRRILSDERGRYEEINRVNASLKECQQKIRAMEGVNGQCMARTPSYIAANCVRAVAGAEGYLGHGSYGCVRMAFTDVLGVVAVKCLALTGSDEDIRYKKEKFVKELQLSHRVSHENVVRVEGYTSWGGMNQAFGIIMEFMPAGTLNTLLFHHNEGVYQVRELPAVIRLRLSADIASGISFIHHCLTSDQRITHGDLKPENILLTADFRCKIADFGGADLATMTTESNLGSDSSPNRNEFTLIYAAPERLENCRETTRRAMDVYSFSMILYTILTRKQPFFDIGDLQQVKSCILGRRHPSLNAMEEHLCNLGMGTADRAIVDLIKEKMIRCWNPIPNARPTMMEVRDSLISMLTLIDVATIAQNIAALIQSVNIKKPAQERLVCVTIDQVPFS